MQLKRLYGVMAVLLMFAMLFTACTAPAAPATTAPAGGEATATEAAAAEATTSGCGSPGKQPQDRPGHGRGPCQRPQL